MHITVRTAGHAHRKRLGKSNISTTPMAGRSKKKKRIIPRRPLVDYSCACKSGTSFVCRPMTRQGRGCQEVRGELLERGSRLVNESIVECEIAGRYWKLGVKDGR